MRVITISGRAQSGKDSTADAISMCLINVWHVSPDRVLITHNADLLKYICTKFFNWDGIKDDHGRTLLQHVGTDIIRAKDSDFWVDFIIKMLTFFDKEWDYVIIPDCRFPNEIEKLRQAGFNTVHIKVVRPGYDNGLSQEQQKHESEVALDDIIPDYYLINNSQLGDIFYKVEQILKEINV